MSSLPNYTQKLIRHSNQYYHQFHARLVPEHIDSAMGEAERRFQAAATLDEWQQAVGYWNEAKSHIETHFELIGLAFQCFTEDPEIEAEEKRLRDEIDPVYSRWGGRLRPLVLNSPLRKELEEAFGTQYFLELKMAQDAFDPKNIEIETQVHQTVADHTKLTGSAKFMVDGVEYPLAHIKKFATSPDERLRRESFQSYSSWFLNHREELDGLFDKAYQLRTQMAKTLGHPNFIPLGYQKMHRVGYGPDDVKALREQIHQVLVPLTQKIRARQAKSLGKAKIHLWDSDYFPDWEVGAPKISVQQQTSAALKVYRHLSPRLGEHFQKMIDWNLIDLESRSGKAPGAFCTSFSDYRVPFIFLNSVNAPADITTMLHETGHSFQGWESSNIDLLELRHPSLEACEVHSMGMEFLAHPYYEEFFHSEDAEKFRKRHLAESILLLPYIAMVDEFQHRIYSGEAGDAASRAKVWEELEDKYMPEVDFSGLGEWRRYRWQRQLHIFHVPFYYIDYAIAQIGAWQLWVESLQDKERAMEKYLLLCRLGGTLPLKDFFKAGGLQLPFETGMLKDLMEEIIQLEHIIE